MATTTMTLLAVVRKGKDPETDFLRETSVRDKAGLRETGMLRVAKREATVPGVPP
jgi:hypothetical protein